MGKTININLFDQKSIQAAVKALKDYENSLTYKCRLLAETLAEKGIEIARVQIADLDAIFTSELLQSIHAEYVGSVKGGGVWAVVAGTDHAAFVEFGTGVVGKQSPYKGNLPEGVDWQYASGNFTEGMPSRPFMYLTAIELRKIVLQTAKVVFGNGG